MFRYLVRAETPIKREKLPERQRRKVEKCITLVKKRVVPRMRGESPVADAPERKVKSVNWIWQH